MNEKLRHLLDYLRPYIFDIGSFFILLFVASIRGKLRRGSNESIQVQQNIGGVMEKVIVDGKEFDMKLVISGGLIKIVGDYVGSGGAASLSAGISVDYFIDELKAKIPGQVDDVIFDIVKAALKAL